MRLHAIPVVGWFLGLAVTMSLSVPFWLFWTVFGLGAKYFYWLPVVYQTIPFWHCVGLFTIVGIINTALVPKLLHVEQTVKSE